MPSSRVQLSHEMLLAAIGDRWSPGEVSTAAELLAGGGGQFPSGIRSLPPDLVSAIQRERLLAATLRATAELGYREMSVQDVLERSGVSRPTFYEHFENKEACFLAAFDAAGGRLRTRVTAATGSTDGSWRDRLRGGARGAAELRRGGARRGSRPSSSRPVRPARPPSCAATSCSTTSPPASTTRYAPTLPRAPRRRRSPRPGSSAGSRRCSTRGSTGKRSRTSRSCSPR